MEELLISNNEWINMLLKFFFNTFFIGILIKIVFTYSKEISRHVSTFLIISVIVFFLCFALKKIDLNFGMALGLFAIFGIIRYRTESVLPEEITYLFVTIGLSVINALTDGVFGWLTLLLINVIVCLSVLFAEKFLLHAENSRISKKLIINLPINELDLEEKIQKTIKDFEKNQNVTVQNHTIFKIDHKSGITQIHLNYYSN